MSEQQRYKKRVTNRGGVEKTRLKAEAKNTKQIRDQEQAFRERNLSKPSIEMLEAKAKEQ